MSSIAYLGEALASIRYAAQHVVIPQWRPNWEWEVGAGVWESWHVRECVRVREAVLV
jgi:hypothetical protein